MQGPSVMYFSFLETVIYYPSKSCDYQLRMSDRAAFISIWSTEGKKTGKMNGWYEITKKARIWSKTFCFNTHQYVASLSLLAIEAVACYYPR